MIRITRNDDIAFNVDEVKGKGERYNITFYTTNNAVNISKTDQDVNDGIIVLNGSELMALGEGVMNFRVDNIAPNADYNDGVFNSSFTKTTKYYILSGIIVPDGSDTQSIIEIVGELQDAIGAEVTRSTTKDNAHDTAIANEATARANADSALSDRITANATAISNTYTKTEIDDMLDDLDVVLPDNIVIDADYHHTDNNYTTTEKNKLAELTNYDDTAITQSLNTLQGQVNNLNIPTKTSQLTNDSHFVSDSNYHHTDNNFTTTEKNKLAGLSNYDDTSLSGRVTTLENAGYTTNIGTITGITMNGQSKGTSGVVDLGTVITQHQSLNGKQDTLVDAVNIKLINGESILGAGNLDITQIIYGKIVQGQGLTRDAFYPAMGFNPISNQFTFSTETVTFEQYMIYVDVLTNKLYLYVGRTLVEINDIDLPDNIVIDANYTHTDNNFTTEEKTKLAELDGKQNTILNLSKKSGDVYTFKDEDGNTLTYSELKSILLEKDVTLIFRNHLYYSFQVSVDEDEGYYNAFFYFKSLDSNILNLEVDLEEYEGEEPVFNVYESTENVHDTFHGTCSTAATNGNKLAYPTGFVLREGNIVSIKFNNDVYTGATLNCNNTGAKAIRHRGSAIESMVIRGGDVATFMYYSGAFNLISVDRVNTEYTQAFSSQLNPNQNRVDYTLSQFGTYRLTYPTTTTGYDLYITLSDEGNGVVPIHTILLDAETLANKGHIIFTNNIVWENNDVPDFDQLTPSNTKYMVVTVYECKYATYKEF